MTTPLLTTKLFSPPPHQNLVPRLRLIDQLNSGLSCKLTLISAPAGFGKSTLLSAWAQQVRTEAQIAWLSLDEGDNDLTRFLTYFIAALQTIERDIGQGVLVALKSPGTLNIESVLTHIINEISEHAEQMIVVLDDYHVIESQPIDQALTFLLDHLPPELHFIVASRIDPSWPLARLRARAEMTEIRVNNLRFTLEEAANFLNQKMGFDLSEHDLTSLGARTEGWIAGLQMAALAMQGTLSKPGSSGGSDITAFIKKFTGSDRYIQDYLTDEVLQQQTADVQDFLLQTSILNRMSGPLCDALRYKDVKLPSNPHGVTSQKILENLEAANLFIIPLDNERRWYRYHHLFADLLKHRLNISYPDQINELHYWASYWYQRAGYFEEAIWHAQAANNDAQLVDILEECWYIFVHRGEMVKLLKLLSSLAPEFTRQSAPLCMAYAWAHYLQEDIAPIPNYLQDIQNLIDSGSITAEMWEKTEFAVIPSLMETLEASQSLAKENLEDAKMHATRALSLVPADPDPKFPRLLRAAATFKLAQVHLKLGEYSQACTILCDVLEMLKASEDYFGAGNILFQIVSVYQDLGKTQAAIDICKDTLDYIAGNNLEKIPANGMVYLILADLQARSGDFEAARDNLEIGCQLTAQIQAPQISIIVKQVEDALAVSTTISQPLVEPLSERELEVLQLIAQGLTNREISEHLYLALDTIKGHNRRVFGKLGVQNRTEAVTRAREFGLLKS